MTSDRPDTTSFAGVGDWGCNDRPVSLFRESSERRAGQKGLLGSCLMGIEACHYPESPAPLQAGSGSQMGGWLKLFRQNPLSAHFSGYKKSRSKRKPSPP